jgi:hypothetical protein
VFGTLNDIRPLVIQHLHPLNQLSLRILLQHNRIPVPRATAASLLDTDTSATQPLDIEARETKASNVHDRVPHVDRHHVGSSPDGARPAHE